MFVRSTTYTAERDARLRAEAERQAAMREIDGLRQLYEQERAEVRRLTDILVTLRSEKNLVAAPETTDEQWGRYTMDEADALREEQERRRKADETSAVDRELLAEIEGEL